MQENRRVRMTKRCMKDALLELLDKMPLNKVSVTDICNTADVNRSTFYAYYNDIEALLSEIETEALAQYRPRRNRLRGQPVEQIGNLFQLYTVERKDLPNPDVSIGGTRF